MYPDSPQTQTKPAVTDGDSYEDIEKQFVGETRSQLATLTGEIALRNKVINTNDAYVYGDLLARSIDVPIGHDFTPVNWLRRVCEIHRVQTVSDGFVVNSSYQGRDINEATDDQDKQRIKLENDKKKALAERRGQICKAIILDNGGDALWGRLVENASAVGTSILKSWYDPRKGKFMMEMIEAVEHFYAIWSQNNFRDYDMTAYVYQISKQQAVEQFNVPPTVATSPLGMPLAVLSSANTIEYISTQPMVTVMEVNGRIQGWCSLNGRVQRCNVGDETPINAVIVGDKVKKIIDDPKYMPHFYILPNKMVRRRPWGLPDVSTAAININQTYIETLSDWRTVANKVNFPKYKAFGFGLDTQLPKPKARTVEMIGLGEGQDIQPIQNPNSEAGSEIDFQRQMAELKEEFVRETGISQVLFDNPDMPSTNSNQVLMTGMRTISDMVAARRQLWTPIIVKIFQDALDTLALWDDDIKELIQDDGWYLRIDWPASLKKDDPAHQTMLLNRLTTNSISLQSLMERMGENGKEELDRIREEMEDPFTAAIHGRLVQLLAELKISGPPSAAPPRTTIALKGDLTPYQEGNVAAMHGFNGGPSQPFPPSAGPQGNQGMVATENDINQGFITGNPYQGGQPIQQQPPQAGGQSSATPTAPQLLTPTTGNTPGGQLMSAPGSGQPTPNSAQGNLNQHAQRKKGK